MKRADAPAAGSEWSQFSDWLRDHMKEHSARWGSDIEEACDKALAWAVAEQVANFKSIDEPKLVGTRDRLRKLSLAILDETAKREDGPPF